MRGVAIVWLTTMGAACGTLPSAGLGDMSACRRTGSSMGRSAELSLDTPDTPAETSAETSVVPPLLAVRRSVRFAPIGEPAARYNEPPGPIPHTALGDAVTAAVRDAAMRAGVPVPEPDARLFRACADLAEVAPEEAIAGVRLDDAVIEFALHRNGIVEPTVRLLFGWGDVEAPERFVRELAPKLAQVLRDGGVARLGVGAARRGPDGTGAIVFALQGSAVQTLPIPRAQGRGDRVVIDAVLDRRYREPEVFVTDPRGETRQLALGPGRPGGFVAELACGAGGRRQIEIVAGDATGATVLANFPVWCAAEPPRSLTVAPIADDPPVDGPAAAEQHLLARINRDRGAAGLPPLRWDDGVAAVARGYAEEMRATGSVAHISPTSGSAVDRVHAAGIATRIVLENVARAYGLNQAHHALMNSPGHRANLLSAAATHIGIGVAFGDDGAGRRELFIAQLFTRTPARSPAPDGCDRAIAARL